jgi:peptidoglycan/LPS O-acetylase OafA/YrhL
MLMVLSFHCWQCCGTVAPIPVSGWHRALILLLRHGYLGVHLFLVLSGFCLTYPLAREGAAAMRLDLRWFFIRRAWRILPPYYIALAFFCALPVLEAVVRRALGRPVGSVFPFTAGQVMSHLLMLHNLSPAWVRTINGSFWSLALEWQLYLVFPLLVAAFRRWGPARALAGVLVLTLAYRGWVYALHAGSGSWPLAPPNAVGCWLAYGQVPGRVFEFALGMLAALVLRGSAESPVRARTVLDYEHEHEHEQEAGDAGLAMLSPPLRPAGQRALPAPQASRRHLLGAVLSALLAFGVALGWSSFSPVTDILWGIAFFCLVLYAGGRSAMGGGWLDSRPLVALGTISYSVYLLHEPLIRLVEELLGRHHLSPPAAGALFVFGVAPLMIALGWLYYHAVEVRFVGGGKPAARAPGGFGVRELAPALVEGACSRRVSRQFWTAKTGSDATTASCLTQSGSKLPHSKVSGRAGSGYVNDRMSALPVDEPAREES